MKTRFVTQGHVVVMAMRISKLLDIVMPTLNVLIDAKALPLANKGRISLPQK